MRNAREMSREVVVGAEHAPAEHLIAHFGGRAEQARDLEPPFGLDDVQAGARVPAGADQQQRRAAHRGSSASCALLGMLTMRRSSDSATDKGMRGQPANAGSRWL